MKERIQSIDFLRGAIMIIMAIDHVRVYSGIPAGGPTAAIFFTRWITHYCAPTFVFFAGTSAFLYFKKTGQKNSVVSFLFTRGLILVILELTVVRFFWMFNVDYATFTFAGVIWMLGWCMVILAPFTRLRPVTLLIIGTLMILFQQVFAYVPSIFPGSMETTLGTIWSVFYPSAMPAKQGAALLSGTSGFPSIFGISIFYVLIPWIGVMMAGYGFGLLFELDSEKRKRICYWVGGSMILLFLIVGSAITIYHSDGTEEMPFLFRLLGQQKYPPSQLYILMTLGPVIALIPWAEKIKGKLTEAVIIIGRVPMFYYMLHLLLIHLSAFVVNYFTSGNIHQNWYNTAPFVGMAPDQRWNLSVLYLVWAIDVAILFFACRWYATFKQKNAQMTWLKYI